MAAGPAVANRHTDRLTADFEAHRAAQASAMAKRRGCAG
jgi:hypothetical protein